MNGCCRLGVVLLPSSFESISTKHSYSTASDDDNDNTLLLLLLFDDDDDDDDDDEMAWLR